MQFFYNNKKLDSKTVSNYLQYLNDLIIHIGAVGYLENINLKNPKQLSMRGISKSYYNLTSDLKHLRIINQPLRIYRSKPKQGIQLSQRYTINKPIYILWVSIIDTIESINKSKKVNLSRHKIKFDFTKTIELIIGKGHDKGLIHNNAEIKLISNNKYTHKWIVKYHNEMIDKIYNNLTKYLGKTHIKQLTTNIYTNTCETNIKIQIQDTTNKSNINKNNPPASSEASIYTSCQSLTFFNNLSNTWFINEDTNDELDEFELLSLDKTLSSYQLSSHIDVIEKLSTSTINDAFYPVFIKLNRELSVNEIKLLEKDLAYLFYKNSKILKLLKSEQEKLHSLKYKVRFKLNIKVVKVTKFGYRAFVSGRQYNTLNSLAVIRRNLELKQFGYDGNYDFHSAIYSFARLINTGIFDVDWDIKNLLVEKAFITESNNKVGRDSFKKFSFRVFFASSLKQSYNWYRRAVGAKKKKIDDYLPRVTESTYSEIYSSYQALITNPIDISGDSKPIGSGPYLYNIFVIESLAELRVINQLLEQDVAVKNVFDCFYFKTSQTNVFEVKNVVSRVMKDLFIDLKYLKDLGTKSINIKDDNASYDYRADEQFEILE
jgi:hypothetical protein